MDNQSKTDKLIDAILAYVAENVFDYWHGLGPEKDWNINADGLLDCIAETCNMSKDALGERLEQVRKTLGGTDGPKQSV